MLLMNYHVHRTCVQLKTVDKVQNNLRVFIMGDTLLNKNIGQEFYSLSIKNVDIYFEV